MSRPSFASTTETTNYARLCRLLIDVGTQVLRDTFDKIHPPTKLHVVLSSYPVDAALQSLKKKRVLNPTQWGKLYPAIPSTVSSANFDITLLMVLLRNICCLCCPVTGWDKLPAVTDTSIEANIARVKYYRNTVYGHAHQASVDNATFNTYWQEIHNALVGLGGERYEDDINELKTGCMDPIIKEHYKELLKSWKEDEDTVKGKLVEMEDNIREDLEQVKSEIGSISVKLDVLTAPREAVNDEGSGDAGRSIVTTGNSDSSTVNSLMSASVNPLESGSSAAVFAGANIGTIKHCTFQIYHGDVPPIKRRRRLSDESDEED